MRQNQAKSMAMSDKPSDLRFKSRYFVSILRGESFAGLFHSDWRTVSVKERGRRFNGAEREEKAGCY